MRRGRTRSLALLLGLASAPRAPAQPPADAGAEPLPAKAPPSTDAEASRPDAGRSGADAALDAGSRATVGASSAEASTERWELTTDARLARWRSSEAERNQVLYDGEPDPLYRAISGADGLGFGTHVKGGIQYRHRPRLTAAGPSYSQVALHWTLRQPQSEPGQVTEPALPSGCELKVRLARDAEGRSAGPAIASVAPCVPPGLLPVTRAPPGPPSDLRTLLESAPLLGYATGPLAPSGVPQPCELGLSVSQRGCSALLLRAYEAMLQGFLRGDHDLFVQITAKGLNLRYRLDTRTGDILPASITPSWPVGGP